MKKFLPDLIAILAFIILSFAYFFFRLISKVVSCFSMTRLPESVQDKNRKSISSVPENVRAGQTRFFGGMPTYQMSPSYDSTTSLKGVEKVYRLFLPDYVVLTFYHDAGILYPLAGVWNIGLAGRIRRSDMGILFLFLHSDTGRAYLEVCDIGLYTTYDCRCRSGLPEEIPVGRNRYGPVHRPSDSVESHSDELLFHVCDPVFCRSLL